MSTALVICPVDPAGNPRPNRMIRCLARDFSTHVISPAASCSIAAAHRTLPTASGRAHRWIRRARLIARQHERLVWTDALRALAREEHERDHAFISVHELRLLPVALAMRNRGRVLFDAREYYPRHFEDVWWWRWLHQPFNRALCRRYLHQADHVVTVAPGLAVEYQREFGITCELLPSLPAPCALTPQAVAPAKIRLVHHGLASRSRRIEGMIEMMDRLPERFTLDLLLMPSDPVYLRELTRSCETRPNVRVLPPVPFADLVRATNSYDIGVFLAPPVSFNLRHALPNKFFEYVQARLMVAIGPSPEMAHYVRAHDLGVVAPDFAPASLAATIERLTTTDIARYKQNAHRAAQLLNSDMTDQLVRRLALAARDGMRGHDPSPRIP